MTDSVRALSERSDRNEVHNLQVDAIGLGLQQDPLNVQKTLRYAVGEAILESEWSAQATRRNRHSDTAIA
ncbi:MAG: hypothetical protein IPJ61_21110 [Tessaracoccus sp.]|uniref:hypothetical protein n=1 Tax=Tessaracoccus sp. TaxID=1971211 RepID=UPI001EBE3522|nr:hypothetical protein [Tessaracoccus sp.]MBK7823489.1 hypothetical protein [Tessaracoccus sp.]